MDKQTLLTLIIVILRLSCGAGAALSNKGMSQFRVKPCETCEAVDFNHPYMQTLFMFIGEFGCLVFWSLQYFYNKLKCIQKDDCPENKINFKFLPHFFLFAIPTLCDLVSSIFYNMGMYYCLASIQQMLRNVTTVFVAALSAAIWKDYRRSFDLPQLIGLIILVAGACVVTASSVFFNQNNGEESRNPVLGIFLILGGCVLSALFYITEELFLRKIWITGLFGVGNEGVWGLLFMSILLPIFNVIPNFLSDIPFQKMENSQEWFYQVSHSGGLAGTHASYVLFTLVANFTGMEITKRLSAAARSTFDAMRVILVWIVSFIVKWEKWHNIATPLRFFGFVLLTIGALIYNNILKIIPFLREENTLKHKKQQKYQKINQ